MKGRFISKERLRKESRKRREIAGREEVFRRKKEEVAARWDEKKAENARQEEEEKRRAEKKKSGATRDLADAVAWVTALEHEKKYEKAKKAIEDGADVNGPKIDSESLLAHAVRDSEEKLVKLLLDAGAEVDARDGDGFTPLMRVESKEVAELLVNAGADVSARSRREEWSTITWPSLQGKADVVEYLLGKGADVNAGGTKKHFPIINFAANGHAKGVEIVLGFGADINIRDGLGRTALMAAAHRGSLGTVKALLDAGADVNARSRNRDTALHWTAEWTNSMAVMDVGLRVYHNNPGLHEAKDKTKKRMIKEGVETVVCRIASILLEAGVDVNAKNEDGKTALDLALKKGLKELGSLIKEHGGKKGWRV